MGNIQYFKSSWGDIKNSPGWFGKLCLLALLNFIPVFGQIVSFGYLYGWAREIAWGTHEPMPTRIFANEDGKLYRRGWFILVLTFVCGLIASIVMGIGQSMQGIGLWGVASDTHAAGSSILSGFGLLVYLIGLAGGLFLGILAWIGSMRISIYDRLSAGFQVGKIWKMFRRDTGGIMRIFGMDLLVGFILGFILSILYFIVLFLVIFAGVAGLAASGYNVETLQHMSDSQAMAITMQFIGSAGIVGIFGFLLLMFVTLMASLFVMMLVARAMGYWTLQFDVPRWRGQDDPMPFETAPSAVNAPPVSPYAPADAATTPGNSYAQPMQQPTQPVYPAQQPVQPVYPAQQPTQPVYPAQQSTQSVQPAQQPMYPAQQPTQPVQSAQPAQPTQPVQQPVEAAAVAFVADTAPIADKPVFEPAVETAPMEAPVEPDPVADTAPMAEKPVFESAIETAPMEAPVEPDSVAPGSENGDE